MNQIETLKALLAIATAIFNLQQAQAYIQPQAVVMTATEAQVREYFSDIPVMIEVARCESNFTQYENGKVLKGKVTPADRGAFQINIHYHPDAIGQVETLEGNLAYARRLYEKEGTRPWLSSSSCWSQQTRKEGMAQMDSPTV